MFMEFIATLALIWVGVFLLSAAINKGKISVAFYIATSLLVTMTILFFLGAMIGYIATIGLPI